jgi:hypothetical protein
MTETLTCPVCRIGILPGRIPASRDGSFLCMRCRTELALAHPNRMPVLLASASTSLVVCLALQKLRDGFQARATQPVHLRDLTPFR